MTFSDFERILAGLLPGLSPRQLRQFEALQDLYAQWNARINVISRKDIDNLYLHHVLHSLAIAGYLQEKRPDVYAALAEGKPLSILDLGTGGGFPGIPLAILFPEARFLLCDSIGKKITVCTEIARALGLDRVRTVCARAESLTETFDFVVSRAVTSLDRFYPWVKGRFRDSILYLKGGDVAEEIAGVMGRYRLPGGSVGVWEIRSWYEDPYFDGKLLIDLPALKTKK